MKPKISLLTLLMSSLIIINISAQVPLVFDVENREPGCNVSAGPLANNPNLPDPFEFTNGGRVSTFEEWTCRRNEIKADIEEYEIGPKPPKPANVTATYSGGTLTVTVSENGRTLTLTSNFTVPSGAGPHPIVIGMDGATGTLSSSLFNGVVQVPFTSSQIVTGTHNGTRNANDPFHQFYPNMLYVGKYNAWSWGVSRLIDGLEIVADQLNLDMSRLAVSGCSYAGKMALFAGAFDERVTLTIAQESGGGGINSWRTSQDFVNRTGIDVEKINNTNGSWFLQSLLGRDPYSLPHDHHELIAMIAPRAFLALGNQTYGDWLGDESGYKSAMAALEVWKAMGVEDRFGYDFSGGHEHCQAASSQNNAVQAFVNKFLLNQNANTTIRSGLTRSDLDDNWQAHIDWTTPTISFNPNVPKVTITNPTDNIVIINEETVIEADVTDANNDLVSVEFFVNDVKVGEDNTAPHNYSWTPDALGSYTLQVIATDAEGNEGTATKAITVSIPQSPYGGTPHPIPGTIQLEEYDEGGNGLAYYDDSPGSETGVTFRDDEDVDLEECTDTGGGYNIGWATAGEWLEYTVNVQGSGIYDLEIRAACNGDGRTISFSMDGEAITGDVAIPNTSGWQSWTTVTVNDIQLSAGEHELRMIMGSENYVNLNYITFQPVLVTEPPVVEITSPTNNASFDAPAAITVSATASDPDGTIANVEFYADNVLIGTANSSPYSIEWTNIPAGEYALTAVATDNEGAKTTAEPVAVLVEAVQYPYNGTPHPIPGRIEAEAYDEGGEGLAYHEVNEDGNEGGATFRNDEVDIEVTGDIDGDYNVGYILNGEWLEYTVEVASTGLYDLELRMARDGANGVLHLEIDGEDISGTINVPNTGGWQDWETVTINDIQLEEGVQEIRVVFESNYMNLNYFSFTAVIQDSDNDGVPDDEDVCPNDPNKATTAGDCGCGVVDLDTDADGIADCVDTYPNDFDNDGVATEDDCDDNNSSIGASTTWYQDLDADGLGNPDVTLLACTQPEGYVNTAGDANDRDTDNDGISTDDDCDDTDNTIGEPTTWYLDNDGDGVGVFSNSIESCTQTDGYVMSFGDECPNDVNKTLPGECGCGATEESCLDCAGTPNGDAFYDDCGTCVATEEEACEQDCYGDWGGTASEDVCGTCAGGNTGIIPVTDPQNCIATGIDEDEVSQAIVYPNPTSGDAYLTKSGIEWDLFDIQGKKLLHGHTPTLNLSAYPQGIYLLQVEGSVYRIVKE